MFRYFSSQFLGRISSSHFRRIVLDVRATPGHLPVIGIMAYTFVIQFPATAERAAIPFPNVIFDPYFIKYFAHTGL